MSLTNLRPPVVALSFLAVLGLAAPAKPADGAAEAGAVIDKAITAHGGAANLGKFKAVSAKWEGKSRVENFYWDSVTVVNYQMPDKIRFESEIQNPTGGKFTIVKVVDGTKGWRGPPTKARDLREAQVNEVLDDLYALWVASLVPLKDKAFEFAPAGELVVDKHETVGVKVSRKGRPDVNLYFDKKTGLLLKSERRAKDVNTGEEYTAESIFREHKAFEGVLWATQRLDRRNGKDLDEGAGKFELSEFKAHDKLDEKLLAKP